jgi:phosphotransacetylase
MIQPALRPEEVLAAAGGETCVIVAGPDRTMTDAVRECARWSTRVIDNSDGDPERIARTAVGLAGPATTLAKGSIPTAYLARAMLETVDPGDRLVHVAWIFVPSIGRSVLLADAGINLEPEGKVALAVAEGALRLARRLGMNGGVALLGHSDHPDLRVRANRRAVAWAELLRGDHRFADRPVVGPVSLDLALDPSANTNKLGREYVPVDILLAPDIVTANVLYKAFMMSGDCVVASVALSHKLVAAVPSRSSSRLEKSVSVALAVLAAHNGVPPLTL